MANEDLPEVGAVYTFKGETVTVVSLRKIGRGWSVYYDADAPSQRARLKDWIKHAKRVA